MVPLLRVIAIALITSGSALPFAARAVAEPLDKDACDNLQLEQKKLLTPAMQAALERVRNFLEVEETIKFRCRTGVPKPTPPAPPAPPPAPVSAEGIPVPDRNPNRGATAIVDAKPSQTVADSRSEERR